MKVILYKFIIFPVLVIRSAHMSDSISRINNSNNNNNSFNFY